MRFRTSAPGALRLAASAASAAGARLQGVLVPSQVPPTIHEQLLKIGPVVAPRPTAVLYGPLQQREPYADVSVTRSERYGTDIRHLLDVFAPAAAGSRRHAAGAGVPAWRRFHRR